MGRNSRPHRDSIPDLPARSSVAIPTELPGPTSTCKAVVIQRFSWVTLPIRNGFKSLNIPLGLFSVRLSSDVLRAFEFHVRVTWCEFPFFFGMLNVPAGNVKRMACDELQMYALLRPEMLENSATLSLPVSSLYRARYRGRHSIDWIHRTCENESQPWQQHC